MLLHLSIVSQFVKTKIEQKQKTKAKAQQQGSNSEGRIGGTGAEKFFHSLFLEWRKTIRKNDFAKQTVKLAPYLILAFCLE
jgi:hypothetical protein